MKPETAEKLKKRLPFLKDVDFEDPKTKKNMKYILMLAVLVLLLLTALVFRLSKGEKDTGKADVELIQGDPRNPDIQQPQESAILEIPEGQDRDVLGADNMMEAFGGRRRTGNRDLFESAGKSADDPLGDILSGGDGYKGYETPGSEAASAGQEQQPAASAGTARRAQQPPSPSGNTRQNALEAFGLGSSSGTEDIQSTGNGARGSATRSQGRSRREEIETSASMENVYEEEEKTEEAQSESSPEPTRVRRPNGITTLDDMTPRGSALTSLTYEGTDDRYIDTSDEALFKVMFMEGKKIKNGDKIRILLIDDIVVDGVLVEHNTPLTATCTLNDRLMLTIPSVTINGRIYTLNFQAVDNDGQVGLYCPVTDAAVASEQAMDAVTTVAQSELMQMISGVGGRLMQSGARVMKSGTRGSATVTVDQGYKFYITKQSRKF